MKAIWKLSSMVASQVKSYYTFVSNYTQPFAMGMANVVAPTGDMAAMGGGGSSTKTDNQLKNEIWLKEKTEQDNNYNFFYKEEDNKLRYFAEYINDGGANSNCIAVNAHGNAHVIVSPNGAMYPSQLHEFLYQNNQLYKRSYDLKTEIKINACRAGSSFAEKLSKINPYILVIAPTDPLLGPFNIIEGEGVWVTYKNGELIK